MPFINLDLKHVFQQFLFTEVITPLCLAYTISRLCLHLTFQFNHTELFTQSAPMMTAVVILIKAR